MTCSPDNLKNYLFGELTADERSATEHHLVVCASCRAEYSALDATRTALLSLADEESPRRIAFVSDKVFEPRWWQRLWNSGAQLGFASAAMLAAAIMAHGYLARPLPAAAPVALHSPRVSGPSVAVAESVMQAEVEKRVH